MLLTLTLMLWNNEADSSGLPHSQTSHSKHSSAGSIQPPQQLQPHPFRPSGPPAPRQSTDISQYHPQNTRLQIHTFVPPFTIIIYYRFNTLVMQQHLHNTSYITNIRLMWKPFKYFYFFLKTVLWYVDIGLRQTAKSEPFLHNSCIQTREDRKCVLFAQQSGRTSFSVEALKSV